MLSNYHGVNSQNIRSPPHPDQSLRPPLHRKTKSHGCVNDIDLLSLPTAFLIPPLTSTLQTSGRPLSPISTNTSSHTTSTTTVDNNSVFTVRTEQQQQSTLEMFDSLILVEEQEREQMQQRQQQQNNYQQQQQQQQYHHNNHLQISPVMIARGGDLARRQHPSIGGMHRRNPSNGSSTAVLPFPNISQHHRRHSSGLSGCDTSASSVTFALFNNNNNCSPLTPAPPASSNFRLRNQSQNIGHRRIDSDGSMGGFRSSNYFGLACMSLEELASVTSGGNNTPSIVSRSQSNSSIVFPLNTNSFHDQQSQADTSINHAAAALPNQGDISSEVSDMSYIFNNTNNGLPNETYLGRGDESLVRNNRYQQQRVIQQRQMHRKCTSAPLSEGELRQVNEAPSTPHFLSQKNQLRNVRVVSCNSRLVEEKPPVQNISIRNMSCTDLDINDVDDYDYDYDYRRGD
eukprot:CAMPEP_0194355616 /NCGR_PEP_ID=MMETSP0174-20130528/3503_1 /TAXON_ID=216777 /ORGANISM="Proboscia alata, Strain PI-D3" /LENGTH=456 /DNA_ID=CAMNT_0039124961 /DNA_START=104 /DNA_END=1474 /DNA_ORIENTATION=-